MVCLTIICFIFYLFICCYGFVSLVVIKITSTQWEKSWKLFCFSVSGWEKDSPHIKFTPRLFQETSKRVFCMFREVFFFSRKTFFSVSFYLSSSDPNFIFIIKFLVFLWLTSTTFRATRRIAKKKTRNFSLVLLLFFFSMFVAVWSEQL